MKKLSILFLSLVALSTSLVSCSKDDSPASLVGKWQFNTMEGTYGTQTFTAGTKEAIWADPACTASPSYFQFDQGTGMHYGAFSSTNNCEVQVTDVAYTVDSKNTTLSVISSGGTFKYSIVKLTATEFSWREQATGKDANGNPATVDIVHHMKK